jgi:hypothetical protein
MQHRTVTNFTTTHAERHVMHSTQIPTTSNDSFERARKLFLVHVKSICVHLLPHLRVPLWPHTCVHTHSVHRCPPLPATRTLIVQRLHFPPVSLRARASLPAARLPYIPICHRKVTARTSRMRCTLIRSLHSAAFPSLHSARTCALCSLPVSRLPTSLSTALSFCPVVPLACCASAVVYSAVVPAL